MDTNTGTDILAPAADLEPVTKTLPSEKVTRSVGYVATDRRYAYEWFAKANYPFGD